MREDLGNKLEAAFAGLIQASADEDKVKAAKERATELTEMNRKLDESLEVLRQQVRGNKENKEHKSETKAKNGSEENEVDGEEKRREEKRREEKRREEFRNQRTERRSS